MEELYPNKVWVRLLKPGVDYPSGCFKHPDALYYPSERVVFLVTKHHYTGYSEVVAWSLEETRLLSTLVLSIPEGGRSIIPYTPWRCRIIPQLPIDSDLSTDNVIDSCVEFAIQLLTQNNELNVKQYTLCNTQRSDFSTEHKLYENIDPEWAVLMRGLYTLLKSWMIINIKDYQLMEEAFMNLQISREAAINIIRDHLRYNKNPKANVKDVYNYIRLNFKLGEYLVEDLDMQNESWLLTKHPNNPFVEDYAPWLWADDVYEPYNGLISIYRHIVLDEPGRSSMLE